MSIAPLPPYPSTRARSALSPSQLVTLYQNIASSLSQILTLPPAQRDKTSCRAFLSSYLKDTAHQILQSLIWNEPEEHSRLFSDLSTAERTIRRRVFLLAGKLVETLDLQIILDLCVTYASTNVTRLRSLLSSAVSQTGSQLVSETSSDAVPAFTTLLSSQSQGLYGLRKTSYIMLCFIRASPPDLRRPFARDKSFMVALAQAYGPALTGLAQSYGGFRMSSGDPADTMDQWERIFLETKVALIDSFHLLVRTLLEDVSAVPSAGVALASQAEPAFEVIFALLDTSGQTQGSTTTPFVDRPLLADYQHAYDFSRTLAEILHRTDDARADVLESALRSLDTSPGAGSSDGPGALRLLIRSSGIAPGIDYAGRGPSRAAANWKEKSKAVEVVRSAEDNLALDSAVSQVLDIFPDYSPTYLQALLSSPNYSYKGDAERVIAALLEGTAPSVEDVEAAAVSQSVASADVGRSPAPAESRDEFQFTKQRRNIFDKEEIDVTQVRVGKKNVEEAIVLRDRKYIEEMKADILRRAEEIAAFEDEEEEGAEGAVDRGKNLAYEDELDDADAIKVRDGAESELEGVDTDDDEAEEGETGAEPMQPETILELAYIRDPALFERDGQTRRSKHRADLKAQTGWSDEQIEGWKIMLERNPRKDAILAKHEFTGNNSGPSLQGGSSQDAPRGGGRGRGRGRGGGGHRGGRGGRGGGGGGGGGEASGSGGSTRDRAWKDKNKASRGNHNRKRGHDKKMARAGGPS
ncbi:hypothetical protein CERSUDRAFT_124738 [Gelatoporia subvermispora B]|uniref:CUE domain-containing protein n=1 Tax=Ceriporiopsis subvermispora (strain B) TaxID=914234 RepID=M2R9K7_CERS8|nr:hypothetical protein CERSUDRAFT_124738 [Gelatoporia subvermispora B]